MIHLKIALEMLNSPEPVDLTVLTAKGEIQFHKGVIGLKADHYTGTRNIKFVGDGKNPGSGQIRRIRDCLIIGINGLEVFL